MVCKSGCVAVAALCLSLALGCGDAVLSGNAGSSGVGGTAGVAGNAGVGGSAGSAGIGGNAGMGGAAGSAGAAGAGGTGGGGGIGGAIPPGAQPLFVAGGVGGRRLASNDGENWFGEVIDVESTNNHTEYLIRGSCFGDGVFMFVGGDRDGRSVTTRDGVTWENDIHSNDAMLRNWMGDCAYSDGVFIIAGGNAYRYYSTDMGASWTIAGGRNFGSGHFRKAAATNGIYVAVGHTYLDDPQQGMRATSFDGITWEPVVNGGSTYGNIVAGNGVFLVNQGSTLLRSTNGVDWSPVTMPGAFTGFDFADGEFWVFYEGGHARSATASNWTHASGEIPGTSTGGLRVTIGNGTFVRARYSQFMSTMIGGTHGGNQLQFTHSLDTAAADANARPYWSIQSVEYGWTVP